MSYHHPSMNEKAYCSCITTKKCDDDCKGAEQKQRNHRPRASQKSGGTGIQRPRSPVVLPEAQDVVQTKDKGPQGRTP